MAFPDKYKSPNSVHNVLFPSPSQSSPSSFTPLPHIAGGVGGAIGQWGGQGLSNYAQTGRWGGQSATSPQMTMDPAQNNLGG